MFIKNMRFAFKAFKKHKSTSIINIIGLATGIAASLIIFMIARYDTSYDKWEPDHKNVFRIYTYSGPNDINAGVTTALPEAIRNNISGIRDVSHFVTLAGNNAVLVPRPDGGLQAFPNIQGVVFTDTDFFSIFPHKWLFGSPKSLVDEPNTAVLSKSYASIFFPGKLTSEIIGQPIILGDSIRVTVSGIVEDLAEQSDFDYKIFLSYPTIAHSARLKEAYGWGHWGHVSYLSNCVVRINEGADIQQIENQLKEIDLANNKPEPGMHGDEPRLLSIGSNHLTTDVDGAISLSTIFNLSLVGLFILVLAAINYINLSTAGASLRSKEIAVRKALGGSRKQIRLLFFTETLMITLIATVVAILLTPLLINGLGNYAPGGFSYKNVLNLDGFLYLGFLIIVITMAAGFYPALILSRYDPAKALKSSHSVKGRSAGYVRSSLITIQFVIAQILLIFVIIVSKQINFSLNTNLGYQNKDGIISFYVPDAQQFTNSKKSLLIQHLNGIKGVEKVSLSSTLPTSSAQSVSVASAIVKGVKQNFNVWTMSGDSNFVSLFRIPLLAGTNLSADTASSYTPVLINETLAKQLGYSNAKDAVNQVFEYDGDRTVVKGVLNDFHINSLKTNIPPLLYYYDLKRSSNISILLSGTATDWQSAIAQIERKFKMIYPNNGFDYRFFDQSIERLYKSDISIVHCLKWATGFAIFISCIGLLGLVSFMTNQRTKEIGVRKVLGASIPQIISLLSKDLIKLVLLASIIAFPIGWYLSHKWLQGFAFKTGLSWWIFLVGVTALSLLSFFVLCLRTFKSARANPVDCLRDE